MKRDDEYIRDLLFEIEASPQPSLIVIAGPNSPADVQKRYMHAKWLCDAGYFAELDRGVFRITNQGHDYLATIRDEGIWAKTKETAASMGGVSLDIMKNIATTFVENKLNALLNS